MSPTDDRRLDVALLGATGFTGALTAAEIARNAPDGLRWALAGRNEKKLAAAREKVAAAVPGAPEPELIRADVDHPGTLRELAAATRVVITTVGPYIKYGEEVVAACAAAGTDYADLTGEPEFVDRMYVAYDGRARSSGARIVHACGFDSIPHDLGAQYTVEQLPEGVPLRVKGYVSAGGRFSGGTFHSAITAMSRARKNVEAHRERKRAEPRADARKVSTDAKPHRALGAWALPMPTIDPQVIATSARRLERYGPDFSYGHYALVKSLPVAVAAPAGLVGLFAAAQVPPLRKAMLGRISPGDGPSPEQIPKGWFSVKFVGEGGGQRVLTEVHGGDPGYGETSKMLAQAGLCMAFDDLPETAGQVTTAEAMGPALRGRLEDVGIGFRVLEGP